MRRWTLMGLVVICCLPALALVEFYVAPTGKDDGPGTLERPFATVERAREALRELRAAGRLDGPATVTRRGGVYALGQTLKLEAQDSGTAEAPVVFHAYRDEKPVLSGGKAITGFVPGEGQILKADLAAQGMDRHSLVADPPFVDAAGDDYRLRPNSPAFKLGFETIPVEKIGCYQDPLRASCPLDTGTTNEARR